jgi:hypothetical protein
VSLVWFATLQYCLQLQNHHQQFLQMSMPSTLAHADTSMSRTRGGDTGRGLVVKGTFQAQGTPETAHIGSPLANLPLANHQAMFAQEHLQQAVVQCVMVPWLERHEWCQISSAS